MTSHFKIKDLVTVNKDSLLPELTGEIVSFCAGQKGNLCAVVALDPKHCGYMTLEASKLDSHIVPGIIWKAAWISHLVVDLDSLSLVQD